MEFKIIPFYQPIFDCWTNKIIGYESTTKGEINNELIRYEELYEILLRRGEGEKLDRLARDKCIHDFLKCFSEKERIFVNLSPLSAEDAWFLGDMIKKRSSHCVGGYRITSFFCNESNKGKSKIFKRIRYANCTR